MLSDIEPMICGDCSGSGEVVDIVGDNFLPTKCLFCNGTGTIIVLDMDETELRR